MPQQKSLVHAFVGHQDGATSVSYLASSQAIVSGGKRGEISVWDVRQRQLRSTIKAFDSASSTVRCLGTDPHCDVLSAGSSEGDIKVLSR
jgi:WD40 repeat protein